VTQPGMIGEPSKALPLGIAKVAFGHETGAVEAARRAAALGFDHLDLGLHDLAGVEPADLALPVGDRLCGFEPVPGCTCRAARKGASWDEAVAVLRSRSDVRVEPTPASILNSVESVRAMCAAVPGLRITLDTGWVATWGEDPAELVDLAAHVQLRQARRGVPQVHPDDQGDVDFAAVLTALAGAGYRGLLSVEYFNLPDMGLSLDDPVGWSVDLARRIRPLLIG
jgi:hypothetical protein